MIGLPREIGSVSNLLLFNMQDNPYKKYVVIDPLLGAVTKNRDEVEEENQLAAAPQTIEAGEYYKTELGQTYRYILGIPCICTHAQTHTHTDTHARTHTHTHIHTHTHTHTHTHIFIYIFTSTYRMQCAMLLVLFFWGKET